MAHSQLIPVQLRRGPFTLGDARIAGLSRHTLASKSWKHLGTELYCWNGARENQWELISAWGRLLPPNAVFAGSTAAWLLGLDVEPARPVEVILPNPSAVHSRVGLKVHRCQLQDFDVVEVRGLKSTAIHRTLLDLCCRQSDVEALVTIDMAVSGNLTTVPALVRYACDARAPARRSPSAFVGSARGESGITDGNATEMAPVACRPPHSRSPDGSSRRGWSTDRESGPLLPGSPPGGRVRRGQPP